MQVLEFIGEKNLDVDEFNEYFSKNISPIIEGVTNSKELYEAALLYEASRSKNIPFIEIHDHFSSIVAMMVYELINGKDVESYIDMSPGSLLITLAHFHYNIVILKKRGSVEYLKKYREDVLGIINGILERGKYINNIHMLIIDKIRG